MRWVSGTTWRQEGSVWDTGIGWDGAMRVPLAVCRSRALGKEDVDQTRIHQNTQQEKKTVLCTQDIPLALLGAGRRNRCLGTCN